MNPFSQREVPRFGKTVCRLGLSATFGLSERGIEEAFERGVNYVYWNPTAFRLTRVLKRLSSEKRDRLVIATGPTLGYFALPVRLRVERALKVLRCERLDVLQLYWVSRMSALTDATLGELVRLREEGKVKAVGVSIHDRPRAGKLAEDSPLDLLMIRYNAAHPGAEREIFPFVAKRRPAVVAYTATAWRKLLQPRSGFERVPTAGDCYRFCLSNPDVDVVLTGPKNERELDENLRALEKGPLSPEEDAWIRAFGKAAHG